MSLSTPSRITEGYAVVRLKSGATYVGYTIYDGRLVTVDGPRRVIVNGVVENRLSRRRSWPYWSVAQIVWDDEE
jgi:hypothetical protein